MSTELLAENGVYLTRFYGGEKRGFCYQITVDHEALDGCRYISLTEAQMAALASAFMRNEETL